MGNPAVLPIVGYAGTASDTVQAYWLEAAWRALQREDRTLADRVDSGELDAETAADVVYAAARRVLRNPEGLKSESGAIDDYTESWQRADATEDLYFTAAELRRVRASDAYPSGFAGSIKYC